MPYIKQLFYVLSLVVVGCAAYSPVVAQTVGDALRIDGIQTSLSILEAGYIHLQDTTVTYVLKPTVTEAEGVPVYDVALIIDLFNYSNTTAVDASLQWEFSHDNIAEIFGAEQIIPLIPSRHSQLNSVIRIPESILASGIPEAAFVITDEKLPEPYRFTFTFRYTRIVPSAVSQLMTSLGLNDSALADFLTIVLEPVYRAFAFIGAVAGTVVESVQIILLTVFTFAQNVFASVSRFFTR
jgi:hypothetical protein